MIDESKTVAAGKDHRCDGCYGIIAKGEKHVRYTTSDDATVRTSRWCTLCTELGADLFAIDIRGEDEWGRETYPGLNEVELEQVQPGPLRERLAAWHVRHGDNLRAAIKRPLVAVP